MAEVTNLTITEETLFNLTITDDSSTATIVNVPNEIATVALSLQDLNLELVNADPSSPGQVFKASSGNFYTLRSLKDDNKTIEISESADTNNIEFKIPDAGLSVPDNFKLNADSDATANITLSGGTVDISKAKLTTDLDANSQDINSISTIRSTTGNITTINATTINTEDLNVSDDLVITDDLTVGGSVAITENVTVTGNVAVTGNVTAHDGTFSGTVAVTENITGDDIDTNTGTIDTLNVTTAEASEEFIGDIRGAVRFRAKAGEALSKGDAVYVSGISGNTPVVSKARADSGSTMPAYGLAFADTNLNASVEIVTFGTLQGLDTATDSLELDKPVYVSPTTAGAVTATRPTAATHLVQNIGLVTRVHASAGSIKVGGSGRTNDVPNTFSIQGDITTAADLTANNITVTNDLTSDDITGVTINATDLNVSDDLAVTDDVTVGGNVTITGDVDAATGTITTLDGTTATYTTVNATNVVASGDVDASTGTIDTLDGTTATITTVNATTVNATDVNATDLTLTGDISADDASLGGNVTISGNLTVSGTTTTVNTETIELADNNIVLNSNHTGAPTQDSGLTVERGTSDDAVFQWNETDDKFEVKVGSSHATFKADALETDSLTATSATITTGTIPTLSSTTITGTTINATDLNVSDDLAVTDDVTIGGNVSVTQNITTTGDHTIGGDVDLTGDFTIGGSLIGLGELTDVSAIRIGITNPAEASGDGIVLWDRTTNWALENKLSTSNNADDIHHSGGTAPIGDIVYISNEVINMSANIVATGGTDSTVIKSGEIFFEEGTGGSTYNSQLDAQKLVIDEIRTNKINNRSGTGDITLSDSIVPEDDGTKALGSDANRFSHVYSDAVSITNGLTVDSISPTNVSDDVIDVAANLVPTANVTYSLGSTTNQWHSVHVGPGSLFIDGHKVLGSDATGQIDITTDDDQSLNISAGANGTTGDVTIFSAGSTTQLNDNTINLGPALNTATVNVRGTLDVVTKIEVGDLDLTSGNIHQDATNGNLEIETNGTGYVHLKTADAYVGASVSNALHLDENSIEVIGGDTLTLKEDVDVTGTIKIDDAFTLTSFNPYGVGNNMPVTVAGVGAEDAWAAFTIRSRGEHDFGIGSEYNLVPRGLLTLSAGRKAGSNDDYLNNNDNFGAILFNPYSGYRTGTEWLTPSATIYGIATEDHSANGAGTKIEFASTENQNKAGAADLAHTHKHITFQGTTITSSDTLKIDDDLQVTGNIGNNGSAVDFDDNIKVTGNVASKTTTLGDFDSSGSPAYAMSGLQLDAGDTAWPTVVFKEYAGTDGGGLKPVNLFTNPGFETEVFGGTPSSPAALGDGKRIISINGNAANGATLPGLANVRILAQTKGQQSGSNRGSELIFQTTPENTTSVTQTLNIKEGNVIRIGNDSYDSGHGIIGASGGDLKLGDRLDTNGNNILNSSGDVTVDDNLKVNTNLTVDGNTVLGNANTDTITANGKLTAVNGFVNTILDTATANYLAGLGAIDEGAMAYISDGNAGSKCLAFYDSSNWKKAHSPNDNISSS